MCRPISWLEFEDGNILYLTDEEIFNTKRGKELQDYCKNPVDLVGHGAIRWYYDITGGKEKEVNDFSTPSNFPEKIVKDFKAGKMKKMILDIEPLLVILNTLAMAERDKIVNAAWTERDKIVNPAWIERDKIVNAARAEYDKIVNAARAKYDKIINPAWTEYYKIVNAARAEYDKIVNPARAEYDKIVNAAFWELFSNPENRIEKWR